MGDTPNIAACLQGLAAPDTVVLSAVTARLLHGAFTLEDVGVQQLKGVAEPMPVFSVLGPEEPSNDEAGSSPVRLPFLVGREEELGLLLRLWEQSKAGLGQVVLLSGEAGIGKPPWLRCCVHTWHRRATLAWGSEARRITLTVPCIQ